MHGGGLDKLNVMAAVFIKGPGLEFAFHLQDDVFDERFQYG